MITNAELLAAYDDLRFFVPPAPPAEHHYELLGPVLRVTGQHRGFISAARDVGLRGEALDALIAEHRDYFTARHEAVEWLTHGHDEPNDLTDRLLAAGFLPEPTETLLVGVAAEMSGPVTLPDGVRLRRVSERADFDRIAAMQTAVWGEGVAWIADSLAARSALPADEFAVYVAEADMGTGGPVVVSAGWLVVKPGTSFAGLWGGSTLAQWRQQGIYRALVAQRASLAVELGVRYLQVHATDNSRPVLERLGMRALTTATPYVWTPPPLTAVQH